MTKRERERDLKLIEVYEHRLSINTNFSSKAGYASRINITIDAELDGWSRFQVPFFLPFHPLLSSSSSSCTRAWKCYQAFPLVWGIPVSCMPMILKGRNCSWKLHLDSFLLPPWRVSNSCSITCTSCCADCKNRMWKFMEGERRMMEMMMYDWKWYDCFFSSFLRDSKDSFDIEKNPLKILFLSLQANCNNLCRFNIL